MGTLTLTETMESHKIISLLLLGPAAFAQNCWQCLGTGSTLSACASPSNSTMQVPYPASAYTTTGLNNICQVKATFDVSACPKSGKCSNSQAELVQVSRSAAELELEFQMFKTDMATNATGTVCTSNGVLMSCTMLCEGDLCNSAVVNPNLNAFTEYITTDCIVCNEVSGSANFEACLMGNNATQVQTCAANSMDVGDTHLPGMCVTIVNYNNATMEPVSITRGCGIDNNPLNPVGNVEYSTLGQCSNTKISVRGESLDTISCVKGYVQDIETSEGSYIANYNRPAPSPMNATCLQCNAVIGDMQFDACLNPNGTSSDLAASGVGMSICEIGISSCSTIFYYNGTEPGSLPVMVQRSCGEFQNLTSTDMNSTDCGYEGWLIDSETCNGNEMAMNSSLPCNSQLAEPVPQGPVCYVCKANSDQAEFEECLNVNGTTNGTIIEQCGCGVNACMSATMYNSNGTVIGVQRGCGNAPGSSSQDVCSYTDASDVDSSNVLCTSQCTASGMPCNDYNNPYDQAVTPNSGVLFGASVVLLIVSMLM